MIDDLVELSNKHDESVSYTDKSTMLFGKYKGKTLDQVPAGYLLWWYEQDNPNDYFPALKNYIENKYDQLREEASEEDEDRGYEDCSIWDTY